jgi:predicted ATPase
MDYIEIEGYKSIRKAKVELRPINILIGANGAGKSNFISFFEFLNNLYERKLREYVGLNGGVDRMLFRGRKWTSRIYSRISFEGANNEYSFGINAGESEFVFTLEGLYFQGDRLDIADFQPEANIKNTSIYRANYTREYLQGFKTYHFHDTGKSSPFNKDSHIQNDIYFLYQKGGNLAAFLYSIREEHPKVYSRIVKMIQSIAPFFSDFFLQPNQNDFIRLQWTDKYSDSIYGVSDFSDGTIRFIALTTLFLQPNLPSTLIIDEPELGLHPNAIEKLAGMIQSAAAKGCQVIVSTQSTDLVSSFGPEDIITVDLVEGESKFSRLKSEELSNWLDEYALGDLWKRNVIAGGQP